MSALAAVQLVLVLLSEVLASATKANLPQTIISSIQAAITALQAVHGSDVTKAQLEGLRVEPQW